MKRTARSLLRTRERKGGRGRALAALVAGVLPAMTRKPAALESELRTGLGRAQHWLASFRFGFERRKKTVLVRPECLWYVSLAGERADAPSGKTGRTTKRRVTPDDEDPGWRLGFPVSDATPHPTGGPRALCGRRARRPEGGSPSLLSPSPPLSAVARRALCPVVRRRGARRCARRDGKETLHRVRGGATVTKRSRSAVAYIG